MNIDELLKKQQSKNFKLKKSRSTLISLDEYQNDIDAPRPYVVTKLKDQVQVDTSEKKKDLSVDPNHKDRLKKNTKAIRSQPISDTKATQSQPISDTKATQSQPISDTKATQGQPIGDTKATQSQPINDTKKSYEEQRENNQPLTTIKTYSMLSGNSKKIVDVIYSECVLNQSYTTNFINKKDFSTRASVNEKSINTTCWRLKKQHILKNFIATKGRGTAWQFTLNENIYNEITKINSRITDTNDNSSSNSNINNTSSSNDLPDDWQKINLDSLKEALDCFKSSKKQFFGKKQILLIFKAAGNILTANDVQKSINAFAFGLKNLDSYKGYENPAAFLFKLLKDGDVWTESYFSGSTSKINTLDIEKIEEQRKKYFFKWLKENESSVKNKLYKNKGGNYVLSNSEFIYEAEKYFNKYIWEDLKINILQNS